MQSYPDSLARCAHHPALGWDEKVENRRIVQSPQSFAMASCNNNLCNFDIGTRAPLSAASSRIRPTSFACCTSHCSRAVEVMRQHEVTLGVHHLRIGGAGFH